MVDLPRGTRLAILIDAENISPTIIKQVLLRLQSYKGLILKRAYGDWSKSHLNGWKSVLPDWGIQPVHAPTYSAGKNSADMVLTIDAMDLLRQQVNWFCIVSNDSDFTPLAHRLIGSGAKVVGFGSHRASQAFANACHRFIVLEEQIKPTVADVVVTASIQPVEGILAAPIAAVSLANPKAQSTQKPAAHKTITKEYLGEILQNIFCSASATNSWLSLSAFNTLIQKQYPGFACKQLGYRGLVKMVEGAGRFEIRRRQIEAALTDGQSHQKIVEIRLKKAA